MTVRSKAQKWGGSISAPIPAAIAKKLRILPGTPIQVEERNGSVVVTPLGRKRRSLDEMLRACKKKFPKGSPHGELNLGPPQGKEIW